MTKSEKLERFFLKAMLSGWAKSGKKKISAELPGYKVFTFTQGNLRLTDMWCVRAGSNQSSGFTTIWENDVPVWVMHYGGGYPKEVIHVVKAALAKAYSEKKFFGGRGPIVFKMDGLEYHNHLDPFHFAFKDFSGREEIHQPGATLQIGSHYFFGGLI